MKTTIELSDEILIEAKKRAAEERTTLRALIERGLRRELDLSTSPSKPKIRWVVVDGPPPCPGEVLSNRERMTDWILSDRTRY